MRTYIVKLVGFLLFSGMASVTLPAAELSKYNSQKKALDQLFKKAILEGKFLEAQKLLRCGADMEMRDDVGRTFLQRACKSGLTGAVRMLVDFGADVNAADDRGMSPLIAALRGGHLSIVDDLLKVKADPNWHNRYDTTALMIAACMDDPNFVKSLLQANAQVDKRDSNRFTPLRWAIQHGNVDVATLLLEAKATPQIFNFGSPVAALTAQGAPQSNEALIQLLMQRMDQYYEGDMYVELLIHAMLGLDIDRFENYIQLLCDDKGLYSNQLLSDYLCETKDRSGDTVFERFEQFRQDLNRYVFEDMVSDMNDQDLDRLLFFVSFFKILNMVPVMPERLK